MKRGIPFGYSFLSAVLRLLGVVLLIRFPSMNISILFGGGLGRARIIILVLQLGRCHLLIRDNLTQGSSCALSQSEIFDFL